MQFNISFNVTAFLFLLIVIVRFFSGRQFPLMSTQLFGAVLIFGAADILAEIAGCVLLELIPQVPVWTAYAANGLYYAAQIALPPMLGLYALGLTAAHITYSRKDYLIYFSPCVFFEAVLLVCLPMQLIFRIDAAGTYTHGPFYVITYINAALYICLAAVLAVRYRSRLSEEVTKALSVIIILESTLVSVQFCRPECLLTGTGIAGALTIIFFTLQDPSRMVDEKTQAFNYSAFTFFLKTRLVSNSKAHLAVTELHGLRMVNVRFGTQTGDMLLKEIADWLSSDDKTWLFRIGPTRFAMITFDDAAFTGFVEKLAARRDYEWKIGEQSARMTFSACYVPRPGEIPGAEVLMNVIETAVASETLQKISIRAVTKDDVERSIRRLALESVLRESLEKKQYFQLYCQPIYSLKEEAFITCELLARFEHPEFGRVYPNEFIPLIQSCGMSPMLDRQVVRMALKYASDGVFTRMGFRNIHVNLSKGAFDDESMTNFILAELARSGVKPEMLALEITETITMSRLEVVRKCIRRLHAAGVHLAMDDFGTGYSNFTRLLELSFDVVKLDKSLIDSYENSEDTYRGIVTALGWTVPEFVAEGVETGVQSDFVRSLGIDLIQGYYYAKPMPMDEAEKYVAEYNRKKRSAEPEEAAFAAGHSPEMKDGGTE